MLFTAKGTIIRAARVRLAGGSLLSLIVLSAFCATEARADDKKVDSWCAVIEKQIDRNSDEARKPHDSAGTDRLREERRRLDNDAHERHCPGH